MQEAGRIMPEEEHRAQNVLHTAGSCICRLLPLPSVHRLLCVHFCLFMYFQSIITILTLCKHWVSLSFFLFFLFLLGIKCWPSLEVPSFIIWIFTYLIKMNTMYASRMCALAWQSVCSVFEEIHELSSIHSPLTGFASSCELLHIASTCSDPYRGARLKEYLIK